VLFAVMLFAPLALAGACFGQTALTLKTHWTSGAKASVSVTVTGVLDGVVLWSGRDDGFGTTTAKLTFAPEKLYNVKIHSLYYNMDIFLFPVYVGCIPGSVCIDPATLRDAEMDLIFDSNDPQHRLRDAVVRAHFVFL
jgi:hypothetical protein